MPCLICAFQYKLYDVVGPSFMSSGNRLYEFPLLVWQIFLWFLDDLGEALLELLVPAEVSSILPQHAHKPFGEKLQPDKKIRLANLSY